MVPLKQNEYGAYWDLIMIYPKPYSFYLLKGEYMSKLLTTRFRVQGL